MGFAPGWYRCAVGAVGTQLWFRNLSFPVYRSNGQHPIETSRLAATEGVPDGSYAVGCRRGCLVFHWLLTFGVEDDEAAGTEAG